MPSNLSVSVTAETGVFVSKIAVAQAAQRDFARQLRETADTVRAAGGATVDQTEAMERLGVGLATARASVRGLQDQMAEANRGATSFAVATEGLRVGSVRAWREAGEAIRQISVGDLPGAGLALAGVAHSSGLLERTFESLTPASVGLGAALVGLVGALAMVSVKSLEAQSAIDGMKVAFAGMNVGVTDDQLGTLRDLIDKIPDTTKETTEKLVFMFAAMKGASFEAMRAIAEAIPTEMDRTGLNAEEAGKRLVAEFQKAIESANPRAAVAKYFEGIQAAAQREATAMATEMRRSLAEAAGTGALNLDEMPGQVYDQQQLAAAKKTAEDVGAAIRSASEEALPALPFAKLEEYAEAIKQFGTNAVQVAQQTRSFWEQQRATVMQYGGAEADEIEKIDAKVAQASGELAKAQVDAAKKGAEAIAKSAEEQTKALEEQGRAAIETANRNREAADRIVTEWQRVTAGVARSITEADDQIAKLGEDRGGKGEGLDERLQSLTTGLQSQLASLRNEFQDLVPAGNFDQAITAVANFNVALGSTSELMRALGVTDQQTFESVVQDLEKARVAIATYADQVRQSTQQADQEMQRNFQEALRPMTSAFDGFVSAIFTKNKTIGQDFADMGRQMVVSWIETIAKLTAQWIAFEAATGVLGAGSSITKAIGNPFGAGASGIGGLIGSAFGGGDASSGAGVTQALTAAITGQTTATTQNTGGIGNWISQTVTSVAQTLGLTSATTAGATATTASTTATTGGLIPALTANTAALTALTGAFGAGGAVGGIGTLSSGITSGAAITTQNTAAVAANTAATASASAATTSATSSLIGSMGSLASGLVPLAGLAAALPSLAQALPGIIQQTSGFLNSPAGWATITGPMALSSLADFLPGFALGTLSAPGGPAMLHAGEIVVPSSIAPSIRPLLMAGGGNVGLNPRIAAAIGGTVFAASGGGAPSTTVGGSTYNQGDLNMNGPLVGEMTVNGGDPAEFQRELAQALPALTRSIQAQMFLNPSSWPKS